MRHNYFWGLDPGLVNDPSGTILLRVTRPLVTVREGRVYDAVTGAVMKVPEGVTLAEFVAPKYAVTNVESRHGLTFGQMAREAAAIQEDMGGQLTVCVDATGLGIGAADQIRQLGVPTVAVTLTSGSRVTGRSRWSINLPVSILFSTLFSLMSQNRIEVSDPAGKKLIAELKEIEKRVTDQGQESYHIPTGQGHHGDLCYALGLAVVVAERSVGRQARSVALHPRGHERPPGRPRRVNTAKLVIKDRLEESRLQSERVMWTQIGEEYNPNFE